MSFSGDSDALTTLLGLEHAPVAITFHDEVPNNGVPRFAEPMSEPTEDGRSGRADTPTTSPSGGDEAAHHQALQQSRGLDQWVRHTFQCSFARLTATRPLTS